MSMRKVISLFLLSIIFVGCTPSNLEGEAVVVESNSAETPPTATKSPPIPTETNEAEPTDLPATPTEELPAPTALPTPTQEIEPTPEPTQGPTSELPLLVHYEGGRYDVEAVKFFERVGCMANDPALSYAWLEPTCNEKFAPFECSYLSIHNIGWGNADLLFVECQHEAWEDPDLWTEDRYLYNRGIDHFVPTQLIYLTDDELILIQSSEELQAVIGEIDSADTALSAAFLHSGHKAQAFTEYPSGWSEEDTITYFTDTLQTTHVIALEDGYEVLLYDDFDDCTPWETRAVWLHVAFDGTVTELSKTKAYELDDGTCA